MNSLFTNLYSRVKRASLGRWADIVPHRYWSTFVCVGGAADHLYILRRLVGDCGTPYRVLVVGVSGGRDFWAMKMDGHKVVGFDLVDVPDCFPTFRGDAEGQWPFADNSFDVVIMGEILEHLILDYQALKEARRVLLPTGNLIVTVPFLHDEPEYHIRVHTPASIARLLKSAGFTIADYLERPGLLPLARFNLVSHTLALLAYLVGTPSPYPAITRFFGRLEWSLGHQSWIPRRWLKLLGIINWGATFCAHPAMDSFDYKELNRRQFETCIRPCSKELEDKNPELRPAS